jgi:membrane-associated phospholipid phosphatase
VWLATIGWNPQLGLRAHLRFVSDWGPLLAVLLLYDYSRGLAHALGTAVHVRPQISADRALFGVVPTQWLQMHLLDPARVRWYDVAASFIYFSHFVASLGTATVLWLTNRRQWARFVRRMIALSIAGLTGYVLYPAAPPWLAAQTGQLPGVVARLSGRGWAAIGLHSAGDVIERGQAFANPVAAMPSLHAGFALLVVVFFLPRVRRRYWPLLLSYPLLMAATLVYTGEHYVIDIVAGWITVALVYAAVGALERYWSRRLRHPACAE